MGLDVLGKVATVAGASALVAGVLSTIIEMIVQVINKNTSDKIKPWYIAIAVSAAVCFASKAGLLNPILQAMAIGTMPSQLDMGFTALLLSGGSGFTHDFFVKLKLRPGAEPAAQVPPVEPLKPAGRIRILMIPILAGVFAALYLLTGCATIPSLAKSLPGTITIENAQRTEQALGDWVTSLNGWAWDTYTKGSPEKQLWLKTNVNPVINKIKRAVVTYSSAVIVWEDTGQRPQNMDTLYSDVLTLYSDLMAATGKGGGS